MTDQETVLFRERLQDTEDDLTLSATSSQGTKFDPRRALVATFLGLILIGTLLLASPWAQLSGHWAWAEPNTPFSWSHTFHAIIENLFMATSVSCVTGLTVVDIATTYTAFGKTVIAILIQLGGIGIMTLSTLLILLLLGRISTSNEAGAMLASGTNNAPHARQLLKQTVIYVFTLELIGAIILFSRYYWAHDYPLQESICYALFHAIAALCNSGVSLHSSNLAAMRADTIYITTIMLLVTIGSLGFLVLANLSHYKFWKKDIRCRGKISLHSRIVLHTTLWIIAIAGVLFLIFEWNGLLGANDGPSVASYLLEKDWHNALLGIKDWGRKIFEAIAQTTVCRTSGFNLFNLEEATQQSSVVSIFTMLIGGSPGSMAGGIKTTTVVVLFLTMRALIRGQQDVCIHHRKIPAGITREAMVIIYLYTFTLFSLYLILLTTEQTILTRYGSLALFYEVTSALGTVGSSINSTALLSETGRIVIAIAMFLGRLGPLTIAIIMSSHRDTPRIRYPEESLTVG